MYDASLTIDELMCDNCEVINENLVNGHFSGYTVSNKFNDVNADDFFSVVSHEEKKYVEVNERR